MPIAPWRQRVRPDLEAVSESRLRGLTIGSGRGEFEGDVGENGRRVSSGGGKRRKAAGTPGLDDEPIGWLVSPCMRVER
jgi:hypothetical protein